MARITLQIALIFVLIGCGKQIDTPVTVSPTPTTSGAPKQDTAESKPQVTADKKLVKETHKAKVLFNPQSYYSLYEYSDGSVESRCTVDIYTSGVKSFTKSNTSNTTRCDILVDWSGNDYTYEIRLNLELGFSTDAGQGYFEYGTSSVKNY